jgi:uncharacterized membrane protein
MTTTASTNWRLVGIFLLGCVVLSFPVLTIFNVKALVFGFPLLYIYIFTVWIILILLIYCVSRKAVTAVDDTDSTPVFQRDSAD